MDHQAFAQLLGNYGEFIGAIAVVITLGYLATQIRHNTAAVKNEAEQESSQFWYELNLEITRNGEMLEILHQGLKDIEAMTDAERRRFVWFMASMFYRVMGFHKAWSSGHLSDDSWKPSERFLRGMLQHKAVDIWWQTGFFLGSDNFTAYVESVRTQTESDWEFVDIARLFDSQHE